MTYSAQDGIDPFLNPVDAALAGIAINIQLPPSLHDKATGRYEAVSTYAEREGSPLKNRVIRFYPQGSMRIDATISNRGTDDEYDLDIVAELFLTGQETPDEVLDLLFQALKDYPTAKAVERQTRCVTIRYADGMHLDVSPAERTEGTPERQSSIFHADPGQSPSRHYRVAMNAWGFCDWYCDRTPLERRFADAFSRRFNDVYGIEVRADAEVDEVPEQVPLVVKNTATVALQLLKRFRNILYAETSGRIPPSVMMSCFAGHAAAPGTSLSDMVIRQARMIARAIRAASSNGKKLAVSNPIFPDDCFTDRWPESVAQQNEFATALDDLADGIEYLKRNDVTLEDLQDWLRERFGSHVVSRSIRQLNDRLGRAVRNSEQSYTPRGGVYVPSAPKLVGIGTAASAAAPAAARPHTFMGGRWE